MTDTPKFLIDPHVGVGPLRFGMPRAEVEAAMGEKAFTIDRRPKGSELNDHFDIQRVHVIYDTDERVAAVQL